MKWKRNPAGGIECRIPDRKVRGTIEEWAKPGAMDYACPPGKCVHRPSFETHLMPEQERAAIRAAEAERKAKMIRERRNLMARRRRSARRLLSTCFQTNSGKALLVFKSVNQNLQGRGRFQYTIGKTAIAPDWDGKAECGGGLHFWSRLPGYRAQRIIACLVMVDELVVVDDIKIKARRARVLYEVDKNGVRV